MSVKELNVLAVCVDVILQFEHSSTLVVLFLWGVVVGRRLFRYFVVVVLSNVGFFIQFSVLSFLLFRSKPCTIAFQIITLGGLSFFIFHKTHSSRLPISVAGITCFTMRDGGTEMCGPSRERAEKKLSQSYRQKTKYQNHLQLTQVHSRRVWDELLSPSKNTYQAVGMIANCCRTQFLFVWRNFHQQTRVCRHSETPTNFSTACHAHGTLSRAFNKPIVVFFGRRFDQHKVLHVERCDLGLAKALTFRDPFQPLQKTSS